MEALALVVAALGLIAAAQVLAIVGRRRGSGGMTWAGIVPLVAAVGCLVWVIILTASTPSN